jgi:phenylacetate-CoA ligase
MFDTGVRQFRMAMAMVWGRRLNPASVGRLVDDVRATITEFGEPGADAQEVIGGTLADPAERLEWTNRNLTRTARRLATKSPFYARRFAGIEPASLDAEGLRGVPVTTKRDLIDKAGDFLCTDVPGYLATRTTGTTGRPAEIWLSRYEMELWPALGALSAVLRDEMRPGDIMQVNLSSRATAAMHLSTASCRLAGAGSRPLGIVPLDEALDCLSEGGTTLLLTCPSYLGELVTAARRRGMGPGDFRLRRVSVGGEVLSPTLARAACQTLGVAQVDDGYSITEAIPVTARSCSHAHLHHDVNLGLTEVLDLTTGEPAAPGALGTLVITPFFPYRDCMPVFRYDTRDVVRRLPDDAPGCELARIPATSQVLGKADHLLHLDGAPAAEVITPRQLVDAIEALPAAPWPARYRATACDGRIQLTLPVGAINGYGEAEARHQLAAALGVDVDLTLVGDDQATALRRTRSDLHETTFASEHALVGA